MLLPRRIAFAAGSAAVSQGIGGALFVVGGLTPDLGGGLLTRVTSDDAMWMYNPAGNTWISRHAAPVARTDHATAFLVGRIYSFGGFVGSILMRSPARHYDVFDVSTGNWETVQMPRPRAEHAAVAVNGSIFLIGGSGDAGRSIDELR
jgi:N-acetylneuraminic acid mutarotase